MTSNTDWIRFGTGMLYLKKGNQHIAEEIFDSLLADHPSFAYSYEQLGYLRKHQGQADQANEWFKKAIDRCPKDELGYYRRGLLHIERKRLKDAKASFLRVLDLNPSHTIAKVELALIYGQEDDFGKAEKLIEDLYQNDKTIKDCFARLGWLRVKYKDWKGAFGLAYRDYEEGRISPPWQVNLAQLQGRLGDWDDAVDLINRAYELQSSLKDGFARLGWIKFEARERLAAIEFIEKDRLAGKLSPAWHLYLALVYGLSNDFTTASDLIEQAYQLNQTIMDGFSRLGWVGYLTGKGVAFFKEQIKKDEVNNRQSARNRLYHTLQLVASGSKVDNINEIEMIYNESPGEKNLLTLIGWLYLRLGKVERGVELMVRDMDLGRMDPTWLPSYAAALCICGRTEEALDVLKSTIKGQHNEDKCTIGFFLYPDNVFTYSRLRTLILTGITHKDLFSTEK